MLLSNTHSVILSFSYLKLKKIPPPPPQFVFYIGIAMDQVVLKDGQKIQ